MKRVDRWVFLLGAICVFSGCASSPPSLPRSMEKLLSGSSRTAHFELWFRPGSQAAANVPRLAELLERELQRISNLLELKPEGQHTFFVFDNSQELKATTRENRYGAFVLDGVGYVTADIDSALIHELVHLIAAKIGVRANAFVVEGLASALPDPPGLRGFHIDSVVKYHRLEGILPPLARWTAAPDLNEVTVPGRRINGYAIAGSWMRFLFETYGPTKLKRYYAGSTVEEVFGRNLEALESAWLARVDAYQFTPVEEALLETKYGRRARGKMTLLAGPWDDVTLSGTGAAENERPTQLTFAWTKDGVPIRGANTPTLKFFTLTLADSGTYVLTKRADGEITGTVTFEIAVIDPAMLPPIRPLRFLPASATNRSNAAEP
ncbi:MAG: hypothetical protein ABIO94_00405 [Opitutaceae bacterium]